MTSRSAVVGFLFLASVALLTVQTMQVDAGFTPVISDGRAAGAFVALLPDERMVGGEGRVAYRANGSRDAAYATVGVGVVSQGQAQGGPESRIVVRSGVDPGDLHERIILLNPTRNVQAFLMEWDHDFFVQPDGKILLFAPVPSFTIGGVTRNGLARLNRDGSLDLGFDPGLGPQNGQIESVAVQTDGKIWSPDFLPRSTAWLGAGSHG